MAVKIHDYWPYRLSDYGIANLACDQPPIVDLGPRRIQHIAVFCRDTFGIPDAAIHNGLQPLNSENSQSQPQRVILHPSSTEEKKNWCFRRFIRLGKALQHCGYEPIYILGPDEAHFRAPLLTENLQGPLFASLSALTTYVQTAPVGISVMIPASGIWRRI